MPASIKLQREYGDDLAVVFVESQGTSPEEVERFVLRQRWFGTPAMWTSERPFSLSGNGLPKFGLLSADGRLIAEGQHVDKKTRALIDEEIDRGGQAPEGTPKKLAKVWSTFAKGKLAKAFEEAGKLRDEPELAEDAEQTIRELTRRIERRLDRVSWLLDHGYAVRAEELAGELLDALKGAGELYDRASELKARFGEDDVKLELDAGKSIDRALEKLYEDGRDERLFQKLEQLAEKHEGTKAAERARHAATLRKKD